MSTVKEVNNSGVIPMLGGDDGALTMSSLLIAEVVDKQHSHVLRDIRQQIKALEKPHCPDMDSGVNGIELTTYINSANKKQPLYLLDKVATFTLVTGYSVSLRARVVARWMELEAKNKAPAIPTDFITALEALVCSEKQKNALALENSELKPKVAAFEAMTKLCKSESISDYHKIIQSEYGISANQKMVRQWLDTSGYIFKRNKEWHRYSIHHDKFEEKIVPWKKGDGTSKVIYITTKGMRLITPRLVAHFNK